MLPKLHISYGLKEAMQFKINFSCFAIHDTVAVRDSLSYLYSLNLRSCSQCNLVVRFVYFVLVCNWPCAVKLARSEMRNGVELLLLLLLLLVVVVLWVAILCNNNNNNNCFVVVVLQFFVVV
jgi:hypothetical protein